MLHAERLHHLSGPYAGLELALADMQQRAKLLADVAAGIHRHHRDPRVDRRLDRRAERVGVGHRDDEAVGLGGDSGVDDLLHRDHVEGVGVAILDGGDAGEVLGRLGDPVLGHRPERRRVRPMGDDDDARLVLCVGRNGQSGGQHRRAQYSSKSLHV